MASRFPPIPRIHAFTLLDALPVLPLNDPLIAMVQSGSFCPICGDHSPIYREDQPCNLHGHWPWTILAPVALELQAWFYSQLAPLRTVPRQPHLTLEERSRAFNCLLLKQTCAVSMAWMSAPVQYAFFDDGRIRGLVAAIHELSFPVRDLDGMLWKHWAFGLTLWDGSLWIFDPTGRQFGPQWPTLLPWTEYQRQLVDQYPNCGFWAVPLGTRATWLARWV
ncbi:hypothetical protein K504DRAFT_456169 [Pleomassaria siparia CBS 279.74]|uniref:Uncharacterized protein n=1 Tax=Pleomassaria siparia CBS 279.74 TaxID=1314801 RepID=A0A6G1K5N6_9PLEO|nr:hypothetical protein K504DRAFT_456169 [Pleomassaria siparia CBS 279.74]